jgi:tetratricopeptide (TPR) repeat protein
LPPEGAARQRWLTLGVCVWLALVVWAVFGQTVRYQFVNFDDDLYVYDNPAITHGVSWHGVGWIFTHPDGPYEWLPLTGLSRMMDCQIYGLHPGGHHLTNVLLHAASAILLFLALRQMTGVLWRSAFVAAVFAIHPLQVESVAWVTERKNVLSGLFFMLTLLCYAKAVTRLRSEASTGQASDEWRVTRDRRAGGKAEVIASPVTRHPSLCYWLALVFFGFGLLAKTTLVTLPFILLLLDYWPLNRSTKCEVRSAEFPSPHRPSPGSYGPTGPDPLPSDPSLYPHPLPLSSEWAREKERGKRASRQDASVRVRRFSTTSLRGRASTWKRLSVEKIPFFILSAAACAATVLFHQRDIRALQEFGLLSRIGNASLACAAYLGQMFYPVGLAAFYPHPGNHLSLWKIDLSMLALLGLSAGLLAGWRKYPYLAVGWLWYLGMLVPVIGLIQVGEQARADRHTYLPQIGLSILAAWGAVALCGAWRIRRVVLGGASAAVLAGLLTVAYVQTGYWKDSLSLWTHALACTSGNYIAENNSGAALAAQGKFNEAIPHYERALELKPDYADARIDLGIALADQGKWDEAIQQYNQALQVNPDSAKGHFNLGAALYGQGKGAEAIQQFEQALQLNPDFAEAHCDLGAALANRGQWDEAIKHDLRALELNPDYAEAHNNLGGALAARGKLDQAAGHYERALQLNPNYAEAYYNWGLLLAAQGKLDEAVEHYKRAVQLKPDYPQACYDLGNALARQGKLDQAIENYERALQLKPDYAEAHYNFGVALASQGKSAEAMQHFQQGLSLATAQGNMELAGFIRARLKSYPSSKP